MTKDLDLFFEDYTVVMNHLQPDGENGSWNGCLFETYGEELDFVKNTKEGFVWTLVEVDYDGMAIIPGFHWVNRMGYFISKEEWKDEDVEYVEYEDLHFEDMTDLDLMEYIEDNSLLPDDGVTRSWKELVTLCEDFRREQVNSFLNK